MLRHAWQICCSGLVPPTVPDLSLACAARALCTCAVSPTGYIQRLGHQPGAIWWIHGGASQSTASEFQLAPASRELHNPLLLSSDPLLHPQEPGLSAAKWSAQDESLHFEINGSPLDTTAKECSGCVTDPRIKGVKGCKTCMSELPGDLGLRRMCFDCLKTLPPVWPKKGDGKAGGCAQCAKISHTKKRNNCFECLALGLRDPSDCIQNPNAPNTYSPLLITTSSKGAFPYRHARRLEVSFLTLIRGGMGVSMADIGVSSVARAAALSGGDSKLVTTFRLSSSKKAFKCGDNLEQIQQATREAGILCGATITVHGGDTNRSTATSFSCKGDYGAISIPELCCQTEGVAGRKLQQSIGDDSQPGGVVTNGAFLPSASTWMEFDLPAKSTIHTLVPTTVVLGGGYIGVSGNGALPAKACPYGTATPTEAQWLACAIEDGGDNDYAKMVLLTIQQSKDSASVGMAQVVSAMYNVPCSYCNSNAYLDASSCAGLWETGTAQALATAYGDDGYGIMALTLEAGTPGGDWYTGDFAPATSPGTETTLDAVPASAVGVDTAYMSGSNIGPSGEAVLAAMGYPSTSVAATDSLMTYLVGVVDGEYLKMVQLSITPCGSTMCVYASAAGYVSGYSGQSNADLSSDIVNAAWVSKTDGTVATCTSCAGYGVVNYGLSSPFVSSNPKTPAMSPYYWGSLVSPTSMISLSYLQTYNGLYTMQVQSDGNLVLYMAVGPQNTQDLPYWESGTGGQPQNGPFTLSLTTVGNLELAGSNGMIWQSNSGSTAGTIGPYYLYLGNTTGSLMISDAMGTIVWSSNGQGVNNPGQSGAEYRAYYYYTGAPTTEPNEYVAYVGNEIFIGNTTGSTNAAFVMAPNPMPVNTSLYSNFIWNANKNNQLGNQHRNFQWRSPSGEFYMTWIGETNTLKLSNSGCSPAIGALCPALWSSQTYNYDAWGNWAQMVSPGTSVFLFLKDDGDMVILANGTELTSVTGSAQAGPFTGPPGAGASVTSWVSSSNAICPISSDFGEAPGLTQGLRMVPLYISDNLGSCMTINALGNFNFAPDEDGEYTCAQTIQTSGQATLYPFIADDSTGELYFVLQSTSGTCLTTDGGQLSLTGDKQSSIGCEASAYNQQFLFTNVSANTQTNSGVNQNGTSPYWFSITSRAYPEVCYSSGTSTFVTCDATDNTQWFSFTAMAYVLPTVSYIAPLLIKDPFFVTKMGLAFDMACGGTSCISSNIVFPSVNAAGVGGTVSATFSGATFTELTSENVISSASMRMTLMSVLQSYYLYQAAIPNSLVIYAASNYPSASTYMTVNISFPQAEAPADACGSSGICSPAVETAANVLTTFFGVILVVGTDGLGASLVPLLLSSGSATLDTSCATYCQNQ
eukprot:gene25490-11146_t